MHLWNDYEGQTLAGTFPLEKLLRTQGRSAFFNTRDRAGKPAVIRLTEALNDQQQMRDRYRAVQAVGHANLVTIESFGEAEVDGQPLIYLVMEQTQESLADIIRERRLSIDETNDVANAVVGAVQALHAHGLVHGQVDPASVLAAGEVIKLRSDCVRAAPEGPEGARAFRQDVLGVADVLNQSLTQGRLQDASDALALPEPYASIVRNTLRGNWEIDQVAAELRRFVRPTAPPAVAQPVAAPAVETPTFAETIMAASRVADRAATGSTGEAPGGANRPASARAAAEGKEAVTAPGKSTRRAATEEAQLPLAYSATGPHSRGNGAMAGPESGWRSPETDGAGARADTKLWVAAGVVLVLLLLLFWHLAGTGRKVNPQRTVIVTPTAPAPVATPVPMVAPQPAPAAAPSEAENQPEGKQVWRVVAYTYNAQAQAEARARLIAQRHPDLRPEVFTRNGSAPYLVTLGGPLSRDEAALVRARARKEGLARDMYMQNYSH